MLLGIDDSQVILILPSSLIFVTISNVNFTSIDHVFAVVTHGLLPLETSQLLALILSFVDIGILLFLIDFLKLLDFFFNKSVAPLE